MCSENELVSIIMASYNSERWIRDTIASVQQQTYENWELIISDDCSSDNTVEIIKELKAEDNRIRLVESEKNEGAAKARNKALALATGRYIAYLDSDDLWVNCKLEHQMRYMLENNIAMCYTDYDIIDENGAVRKVIHVPSSVNYDEYLRRPITCTHTVVFDVNMVDKGLLIMPDLRRGQDGATWLQVLKSGTRGCALGESLAKYRRHGGSLSSNKFKAIKRTWYLYRRVEKLSLRKSCVCFVSYAVNAINKYIRR